MISPERLALELLEYKVDPARPRAQGFSPWRLLAYCKEHGASFGPAEKARLEEAGAALERLEGEAGGGGVSGGVKSVREAVKSPREPDFSAFLLETLPTQAPRPPAPSPAPFLVPSPAPSEFFSSSLASPTPFAPSPAVPGAARGNLSPAERAEEEALKRLARRVWWFDLEDWVGRVAASCRAERERTTARLLYALLRNLERYAKTPAFAEDVSLAQFGVLEPVPALGDPLASFNALESIAGLVRELIESALGVGREGTLKTLKLPPAGTLSYLEEMARKIAEDPYAGRLGAAPPKGTSSRSLRLALEELAKEPLSMEMRERGRLELEARLQEALAFERTQEAMFRRDVGSFLEAAERFFEPLAAYLPERVGGNADEAGLPGGVLFAHRAGLRIDNVPITAQTLTLRLRGPTRFSMGGAPLALVGSGPSLGLFANGQEVPLTPQFEIGLGRQKILGFKESDYVHLRVQDEARSLAALLAEGLTALFVLTSPYQASLLSVLKTLSGVAGGEPQEVVRRAVAHLAQWSVSTPDLGRTVEGFLSGAAKALHLSLPGAVMSDLTAHICRALSVSSADLTSLYDGVTCSKKALYGLSDEPVSVVLDGVPLTIRRYKGRPTGAHGEESVYGTHSGAGQRRADAARSPAGLLERLPHPALRQGHAHVRAGRAGCGGVLFSGRASLGLALALVSGEQVVLGAADTPVLHKLVQPA